MDEKLENIIFERGYTAGLKRATEILKENMREDKVIIGMKMLNEAIKDNSHIYKELNESIGTEAKSELDINLKANDNGK